MPSYLVYKNAETKRGVDVQHHVREKGGDYAYALNQAEVLNQGAQPEYPPFDRWTVVESTVDVPEQTLWQWWRNPVGGAIEELPTAVKAAKIAAYQAYQTLWANRKAAYAQMIADGITAATWAGVTALQRKVLFRVKDYKSMTEADWATLGV